MSWGSDNVGEPPTQGSASLDDLKTQGGEHQGLPATGNLVRNEVMDIVRFADGHAQEECTEYSGLAFMQQLGVAPVPAA